MKNQRWYDEDPTLSLAISFLRNAQQKSQHEVAEKIIEKASSNGVVVNDLQIVFNKRWYDEDERLRLAIEYLKNSSQEHRKLIALEIIEHLTQIKN
jgi:ABC-type antimicrobial peptide transport system ATPase subunit